MLWTDSLRLTAEYQSVQIAELCIDTQLDVPLRSRAAPLPERKYQQ